MKGTHVDRLTRTSSHVRCHSMALGDSILRQRNVPAQRKTHRITDKCDPVSYAKRERFYDV